jgi:hypothetical protein
MKKILLSMGLFSLVLVGKSQTVLNEVYSEPGNGKSEFIEMYNSSTIGAQNVDCFTVLTYWESGANKGWYVMDLPNVTIPSKGWYVLAAATPFNVQSQTNVTADLNWNDAAFRASSDGYLKKYQVSGSTYTEVNINTPVVAVNDLSVDVSPAGATGHNYFTFLLQNGVLINGFWGGGSNGTLPSGIKTMPALSITPAGSCGGGSYSVDFSSFGAVEFVNQAPGSDNGYARTSDGKCGAWTKTSSSVNHTPGATNGSASSLAGSLTTAEVLGCNNPPSSAARYVQFDITAVGGSANETDDFPVQVQVYNDANHNHLLDGSDFIINTKSQALVASPADTVQLTGSNTNADVILVYKTKRGCFDKLVNVLNSCIPLPVNFKSFTAVRNNASTVSLKWETITEQNSRDFVVERNINGTWIAIGTVASQAQGGNSNSLLTYTFVDNNNFKGISQYRVRQVDFDNRSRSTEIKAVRGENQKLQLIIYPNPSFDGKVNVVFDNATGLRDLALMDMSGRVVKQINGVTNDNITLDNLTPGIYTLRVIDRETGEQNVQKVVINKR